MNERNARSLSVPLSAPNSAEAQPPQRSPRTDKELCLEIDDSARHSVQFSLHEGDTVLFLHSDLEHAVLAADGRSLAIAFSTHEVRLEGANLGRVMETLARGLNLLVREADPARKSEYQGTEPLVSRILLLELDDDTPAATQPTPARAGNPRRA